MQHGEKYRKQKMIHVLIAIVLAAAMAFSCSAQSTKNDDPNKPNPTLKTVTLRSGDVKVVAEVAATELERNRGLMFRKNLEDGKGMLFVFDADQRVAFWMKNTSLPLSLAYIGSDGRILQILDLQPFSEQARPSERSVRYALEVPQGWFSRVGLEVGDSFDGMTE
ncbi:MAG: DUF192 domain-containing protein [Rectinemataceae bacterium]|nr:DUF192 domain-containing protein [Rectinemataceae bacterium]